jgi:hypothetical protein
VRKFYRPEPTGAAASAAQVPVQVGPFPEPASVGEGDFPGAALAVRAGDGPGVPIAGEPFVPASEASVPGSAFAERAVVVAEGSFAASADGGFAPGLPEMAALLADGDGNSRRGFSRHAVHHGRQFA